MHHPTPETFDPNLYTPDPRPQTPNPGTYTLNIKPYTIAIPLPYKPPLNARRSQIVCTLGPKSAELSVMEDLLKVSNPLLLNLEPYTPNPIPEILSPKP